MNFEHREYCYGVYSEIWACPASAYRGMDGSILFDLLSDPFVASFRDPDKPGYYVVQVKDNGLQELFHTDSLELALLTCELML